MWEKHTDQSHYNLVIYCGHRVHAAGLQNEEAELSGLSFVDGAIRYKVGFGGDKLINLMP